MIYCFATKSQITRPLYLVRSKDSSSSRAFGTSRSLAISW